MQQDYCCPNCGSQVAYGVVSCWNCGTILTWQEQQQIQPLPVYQQQQFFSAVQEQQGYYSDSDQQITRNKVPIWLTVGGIVLAIGCIIGAGIFAVNTLWRNNSITASVSDNASFKISNLAVVPAETSATITWDTDKPSTSQVEYGITANYGSFSASQTALVSKHSVLISGLKSGTRYQYRVISADKNGAKIVSNASSFATLKAKQSSTSDNSTTDNTTR